MLGQSAESAFRFAPIRALMPSRGRTPRQGADHIKLYWSEGGEVACEKHRPFRGSDSFVWGHWRPMRLSERIDFEAEMQRALTCETCDAILHRHHEGCHAEKQSDECALCTGGAA